MIYIIILPLFATMSFGYQRTLLGNSVDKASMKILQEAFLNAGDKNLITSPLGALTLLSMYSAGTEREAREEIMQLLGSTDYKQIEESYGSLMERFSSMDPSYFVLANKVYVSNNFTLNDHFSDVTSRSYKSEVEQVDFSQKIATVDIINKWANEKTKGHITSPVNEEMIDTDTTVALMNAIFFQGHWHVPFNANVTKESDFYIDESQTVKKPMMKLHCSLLYYNDETIGARIVELPYKEKDFRMIIVLPDKVDGLAEVMEKLAQKGIFEHASKLTKREVDFEMPKFEIRTCLDLNSILPKVGVSRIFNDGASGIVREVPLVVSKAFQEAFVKVDEEGATAAAFTGFFITFRSALPFPVVEFKVDHPFLFAILHEDIVLFTGTYTH